MVTDKPSDTDVLGSSGARRKTRPPVIELEATEVTPSGSVNPNTNEASAKAEEETQARADTMTPSSYEKHRIRLIALTGAIGTLVGALVIALIFLFFGDGIARLSSKSGETAIRLSSDTTALNERIEQLIKLVSEYEKRIATIENRAPDLTPLMNRSENIETAVSDLRRLSEQMQTSTSMRMETLADRMTELENRLKRPIGPPIANATEIIALGALQDAILKGTPYAKELSAVRASLGDRAGAISSLDGSAESGLPTVAALSAQFAALATKLAQEPESESGYIARLLVHARRLVEVRPIGEAQGASVGAVVARIETRLARGDLSAALDEASRLPASAKMEATDWIVAATRRCDAEIAIKKLLTAALVSVTMETQKP
jgi:hypothetical protein